MWLTTLCGVAPASQKNGPQPADLPAAIEEATAIPIAARRITMKTYEDSMCTVLFLQIYIHI